jgi:transketolase
VIGKIKFNEKKIKLWSQLGQRAAFGLACLEIEKKYPELLILTSDVSTSAGLDRFRKQVPAKFVEVGISEQNLIGVASGLASEGFKVITTTFSPFQTLRCCEQIKVNLGYMKHKVCMVGLASGVVLGNLGYTHCSIEDIAVLRSIPNITIISPADVRETIKSLEAALNHHQSVYIRLTGGSNNSLIYEKDYKFKIGKAISLQKGKDLTIFATGMMVKIAKEISLELQKNKIKTSIINIHTIKPIDKKMILKAADKKKLMVSIEEHNKFGGLGTAISEVLSEMKTKNKLLTFGLKDSYEDSGSYEYILKKNGLTVKSITNKILKNI